MTINMRVESWMGHSIRFVEKEPGEWFGVAQDVARALNYKHTPHMLRLIDEDEKDDVHLTDSIGRKQKMAALSETGIYDAIYNSHRPEAKEFKKWVKVMLKQLRQQTGLEGFQIFRMLDKDHQKEAMSRLKASLSQPVKVDFIKANTIANKTTSSLNGHPKMIKKDQMTPKMLVQRQEILDDTVNLMSVKEKFGLDLSVSKSIYGKYLHMRTKQAQ
ncbi:BRO-N domain-containing protein [Brevibacillus brevis]|uniref:BRO-N domain-containing protein n=1 Tax=Brevibacillus brevis TaxID=1393 RepID=UPI002570E2BB|nr:Bro-N domain-containing protein [Lysinibacillus sp. SDF0063]